MDSAARNSSAGPGMASNDSAQFEFTGLGGAVPACQRVPVRRAGERASAGPAPGRRRLGPATPTACRSSLPRASGPRPGQLNCVNLRRARRAGPARASRRRCQVRAALDNRSRSPARPFVQTGDRARIAERDSPATLRPVRIRDGDHPEDAEAVRDHAEARRPEGRAEGHPDRTAVGEGGEKAPRLFFRRRLD